MDEGWFGFNVPFVLSVDDSLLSSPVRAADPLGLDFETVVDNETGEEVGERPAVHVSLTEDETKTFERFVRPIAEIMSTLRVTENRWEFLDIAWGYFIKAFFSPSNLEQLLWHIVALEALLGERRQGVSSRIPRRIASILGRNEEDKKAIKKAVDELYNFRSDLVHGSKVSEEIYVGHLREARNIARRTLHWFIRYLDHIQTQMPSAKEEKVPTREDILTLLDLDHSGRLRVGKLVESLPSGFPNVPEWCQ
jgi:hypothetical protein